MLPPVSYFMETLPKPASPSPKQSMTSPSMVSPGAASYRTTESVPSAFEEEIAGSTKEQLTAAAAAERDRRKAVLSRIHDHLEELHGPCYTATLMGAFISSSDDLLLIHHGAKGIIRCVTAHASKM